ncbi:hypothetical protein XENOCAPTIV_017358, partial [Xenoophorus captivus]
LVQGQASMNQPGLKSDGLVDVLQRARQQQEGGENPLTSGFHDPATCPDSGRWSRHGLKNWTPSLYRRLFTGKVESRLALCNQPRAVHSTREGWLLYLLRWLHTQGSQRGPNQPEGLWSSLGEGSAAAWL